jgi:hypothetical protein
MIERKRQRSLAKEHGGLSFALYEVSREEGRKPKETKRREKEKIERQKLK